MSHPHEDIAKKVGDHRMIRYSLGSAVVSGLLFTVLALLAGTPMVLANVEQGERKARAITQQASAAGGTSETAASVQREQLQQMQRLDDRLLNTVHWSLGVVVFMAVLLAGFSWYTNFRVYERDKAALRDELQVLVSRELENSREQLRSRFEQAQDAIRSTLRKDLDESSKQFTDTNKAVTKSLEHLERRIDDRFSRAKYDHLELKIEVEELSEAVPSNRLRTYIQYLRLTVEFEWSFAYIDALKQMEKLMRDGSAMVSSDDLVELNAIFAKIPADFSAVIDGIRKLIPTHTSAL